MKHFLFLLLLISGINLTIESSNKDLLVINETVRDINLLRNSTTRQADVLIVNNESEIWFEIYQIISRNPEITQVHLLLPSSEGELMIGNVAYNVNTISDVFDLQLLKNKDISLLFYGSNLAEVDEGKALINKIADITKLPVLASTTTTAGKYAGGDWALEYCTNSDVAYEPIFNEDALKDYPYNF